MVEVEGVELRLLVVTDERSARWLAAEARCSASYCSTEDLRIVAEEQAAWDAANPEVRDGGD